MRAFRTSPVDTRDSLKVPVPAGRWDDVSIFRRTPAEPEKVDVAALLAGYEVTSTEGLDGEYASGYSRVETLHVAPGQIAAPPEVHTDRRGALRYPLALPVRARTKSDDDWLEGRSIDASMTGLCVEMASVPCGAYLDVEIDGSVPIAGWARVVGYAPAEGGRFKWRLRLVSYDAGYPALLDDLEPIETGFAPAVTAEPDPDTDEDVVVGEGRWGQLLDRATA
jgi:hypothetical protein